MSIPIPAIWTAVLGNWFADDSAMYLRNDSSASEFSRVQYNPLLQESYVATVIVEGSGGLGWEFRFNVQDDDNYYACRVNKFTDTTFSIVSRKSGVSNTLLNRLDTQIVGVNDFTTLANITGDGELSTHTMQILGNTLSWSIQPEQSPQFPIPEVFVGGAIIPDSDVLPSGRFVIGGSRDIVVGTPLVRFNSVAFSHATPSLFIKGLGSGVVDVDLFLKALDQAVTGVPLVLLSFDTSTSGIDLSIPNTFGSGVTPIDVQLFNMTVAGIDPLINAISGGFGGFGEDGFFPAPTLFMSAKTADASGLMNLSLIGPASATTTGVMNLTLFGRALIGTSINDNINLYLSQSGEAATVPLYIGSSGITPGMIPANSNMNLFLDRAATQMVPFTIFGTAPTPASGMVDLFVGSIIGSQITCATDILRPSGTLKGVWATSAHNLIDEVVLNPNPGNGFPDLVAANAGDVGEIESWSFTKPTITTNFKVEQVRLHINASSDVIPVSAFVTIKGVTQPIYEFNFPVAADAPEWDTADWFGSWDISDFNNVTASMIAPNLGGNLFVDVIYIELCIASGIPLHIFGVGKPNTNMNLYTRGF